MSKGGYVYILTNKKQGTLYIGVTSDLIKRVHEHKHKVVEGFSKKYNTNLLVYYEQRPTIEEAIQREKQLKAGSRKKKIVLIEKENSAWNDLYDNIIG